MLEGDKDRIFPKRELHEERRPGRGGSELIEAQAGKYDLTTGRIVRDSWNRRAVRRDARQRCAGQIIPEITIDRLV